MPKNKTVQKITDPLVDFAQWYTDTVLVSGLACYAPLKGTIIFKPYGWALWKQIEATVDRYFALERIETVYFPLLVPESLFQHEAKHVTGFNPELIKVDKVGDKTLTEPLILRPTSEVLFSQYFHENVQSYQDLPIKYNQWANVFRWEKNTKPFLRTREFLWQEGHSCHVDYIQAYNQAVKMAGVYAKVLTDHLALPFIAGEKSPSERFAGAEITMTLELLMPDGQALQAATSHYLGQKFAEAFKIQYRDVDNQLQFAHQSSWGMSTRIIGGLIMVHGDSRGLVLPPAIAPIQIIIVPVDIKDEAQRDYCFDLVKTLQPYYRVKLDESANRFGYKLAQSEVQGIPVRLEIGPNNLNTNEIDIFVRYNASKKKVLASELLSTLKPLMTQIHEAMLLKAKAFLNQHLYTITTWDTYLKALETTPGLYLVPFCGQAQCEAAIKAKTSTTSRCAPETDLALTPNQKCFACDQLATKWYYFGRAY